MKYYTVIVRLEGALADAVALEWTSHAAPLDSGQGWEPCLRRADGTWRFSSHDPLGADLPHRRGAGAFGDIAIRYRLDPAGPWSAASPGRKEIVIVGDGEDDPIPPGLLLAPSLIGSAVIGTELAVDPGLWSGFPPPDLAFQWRRDATAIPGAVARSYAPVPEDDRCALDCAVGARNLAGATVVATAALRARYPAPTALGDLPDEVFDEGVEPEFVDASTAFVGADLSFTAVGAAIDPDSGVLVVPTDAPASGVIVTVTATNSGGSASARLVYTVEAAPIEAPPALGAGDIAIARSVWRPAGQETAYTPVVTFPGLAGETAQAIEWTTSALAAPPEGHWEVALPEAGAPAGRHGLYMRDPARRDPLASPKVDFAVFGLSDAETTRAGRLRFRWRRAAGEAWSPPSAPAPVPRPATTPAERLDEWRLHASRSPSEIGAAKARPETVDLYPHGRLGGGGGQGCNTIVVTPFGDLMYQGDMNGFRVMRRGTRMWHYPIAERLQGQSGSGVAADPADRNVVLAIQSNGYFSSAAYSGGIFRSADDCRSFDLVQEFANCRCDPRQATNLLACHPASGGAAATRKWRALEWSGDASYGATGVRLWVSTGGLAGSWTSREMPAPFANGEGFKASQLVQHPADAGVVYLTTSEGVYRNADVDGWVARGAPAWTRVGGTELQGAILSFWIDPEDPAVMLCARSNGAGAGVYYSASAGSAWTRVLDQPNCGNLGVGPKTAGDVRTLVCGQDRATNTTPWVQDWAVGAPGARRAPGAGTTTGGWETGKWKRARVVVDNDDVDNPWKQSLMGKLQTSFLPDPTDPNVWHTNGYMCPWTSSDRGRTWVVMDDGFSGANPLAMAFSATEPDRCDAGITDQISHTTTNRFRTRTIQRLESGEAQAMKATAGGSIGVKVMTTIPNSPEVPAAKRGRSIASIGNGSDGQCLGTRSRDEAQWALLDSRADAAGGGWRQFLFAGGNPSEPNAAYIGPFRTLDAGDSFAYVHPASKTSVIGVSQQDPRRLYGYANEDVIRFSTDRGASWETWFSLGHSVKGLASILLTQLNPFDDKVMLSATGQTLRVTVGDPGAQVVRGPFTVPVNPAVSYRRVRSFTWCEINPLRAYVCTYSIGYPRVFRVEFNSAYSAATFVDVTGNVPLFGRLYCNPLGEVFLSGAGQGIWVLPPPEGLAPDVGFWREAARPVPRT